MSPRKKRGLPDITPFKEILEKRLGARYFPVSRIPDAVSWARAGNISVHENFASRRKQAYHVISGSREKLEAFCRELGLPTERIKASEFYRFWHLTWFPHEDGAEGQGRSAAN